MAVRVKRTPSASNRPIDSSLAVRVKTISAITRSGHNPCGFLLPSPQRGHVQVTPEHPARNTNRYAVEHSPRASPPWPGWPGSSRWGTPPPPVLAFRQNTRPAGRAKSLPATQRSTLRPPAQEPQAQRPRQKDAAYLQGRVMHPALALTDSRAATRTQRLPRLPRRSTAAPCSQRPGPLGVPGYDARGVGPRGWGVSDVVANYTVLRMKL